MVIVEGLRSSYDQVGGLVHFGRMLDKMRLHSIGKLPQGYIPFLGQGDGTAFDGRVCRFLRVNYDEVTARARQGGSDEKVLEWAKSNGRAPTEEQIEVFNAFLTKRGWRDPATPGLEQTAREAGIPPEQVLTFFDCIDMEEGRPLRFPLDPPRPDVEIKPTVRIEGLRSPYDTIGGVVHFGRMLDKIRLHAKEALPPAWIEPLGGHKAFDGLCCRLLGIDYADLTARTLEGASDDELINWALATGAKPSEEEIFIWNSYMAKRNWRDVYTPRLHFRLEEAGMPIGAALTMFDFIDLDEGRRPRFP